MAMDLLCFDMSLHKSLHKDMQCKHVYVGIKMELRLLSKVLFVPLCARSILTLRSHTHLLRTMPSPRCNHISWQCIGRESSRYPRKQNADWTEYAEEWGKVRPVDVAYSKWNGVLKVDIGY